MTVLQKALYKKVLIILVAAVLVYSLMGFFLAPYLVSRMAPDMVTEKINRELRLGLVKINPFLFSIQVDDAGLYEPDGTLIAGFKSCFIDFELSSILRWALVFKWFRLDEPKINFILDKNGVLNLTRLVPENRQPEKTDNKADEQQDTKPPRLVLQHIRINRGEIDFIDQRQTIPASVAIRPLNLELNDISTLPDREGPYSLLATTEEQEAFKWTGEITLNPFRSNGVLGFDNIKSATIWQFFRDALAIQQPDGHFNMNTGYVIDFSSSEPTLKLENLEFSLFDLGVRLDDEKTSLLNLAQMDIKIPLVDLTRQHVDVGVISLQDGITTVIMDDHGRLNWTQLMSGATQENQAAEQDNEGYDDAGQHPGDAKPWDVSVNRISLDDIQLNYQDQSRLPRLYADVKEIGGQFQVDLVVGQDNTDLKVVLSSFGLNDIQLGNMDRIDPEITIASWVLKEGEFDLRKKSLKLDNIFIQNGAVNVRRETDGGLNLIDLFVPESNTHQEVSSPGPENNASPFQFLINNVELTNTGVYFSDQTVKPNGNILHMDNLNFMASNIDGKNKMPVDLSFDVREGGRVHIQGVVDPDEPSVKTVVNLDQLFLAAFESYLKTQADLKIVSGTVSTHGQFSYGQNDEKTEMTYIGDVDVGNLNIWETGSEKTLLGWKHFATQDLNFSLNPDRLEITDLKLEGLDGQFIIFEDGSLNLANAFGKKTTQSQKAAETEKATETQEQPQEGVAEMFPVYIHKLRFEEGQLFFADYNLPTPFATKIHQLNGSVIGMSSARDSRAQVQLDGRVNNYGMSKIEGEINFFDPTLFTDMSVLFRNLEMTRLSPYSGKFVGRRIDSGKLSLELSYFIEDSKLKGDNQVVIERIELGESIDSPDAVSLPLNLAIAILEDADGVIDIGLPVSGDLEDPKFSYGTLIWKTFTNLIKKLATAPFRALGALLGGENETLDVIFFENGSHNLLPPEAEKLAQLAGALKKRPNLRLVVQGRYHLKKDGAELKALQLRRHIAGIQGIALKPGEDPGLLDFGNPDIQTILENQYMDRFGLETLNEIRAGFVEKQPGTQDQTAENNTNAVQNQDPVALWKKLYGQMVVKEALAETDLIALAEARTQVVLKELNESNGLDLQRIMVKPAQVLKSKKTPQTKLTLEAMKVKRVRKKVVQ